MLPERALRFLEARRVGHLATSDTAGTPHVMPVCYALEGDTLYVAIDRKPKRTVASGLRRLANIAANPSAALVVDRYDEDWTRLGWVMLRGRAEILREGQEHARAQALARSRYPQLAGMDLDGLPVIALRIERVTSWGEIDVEGRG